jgi:hypothetical protein
MKYVCNNGYGPPLILHRISDQEFAELDHTIIGMPVYYVEEDGKRVFWPKPTPEFVIYECVEIKI